VPLFFLQTTQLRCIRLVCALFLRFSATYHLTDDINEQWVLYLTILRVIAFFKMRDSWKTFIARKIRILVLWSNL